MKKVLIYFTDTQYNNLKTEATEKETSMTEIVRKAIKRYFKMED